MSSPTGAPKVVRRRNGSKHDKTGCLTCRYRRKKCTENTMPVCGACARLNLECVRQEKRDVVPEDWASDTRAPVASTSNASVSSTSPNISHRPLSRQLAGAPSPSLCPAVVGPPSSDSATSCMGSSQMRRAMAYYISVLAGHLTVSGEFNSFLTAFLPMSMESPALFDVLIATSSGHLSLTDESYVNVAVAARSRAITSLATAISTPAEQMAIFETTAAASLGLVIYEAGVGDCRAWHTHLQGTQNIIKSASINVGCKLVYGSDAFKRSTEGQWILRNFAYHDIIGSVTLQKPPLLHGEYLEDITDVVDSCVGIATGLLGVIARIMFLDHDTAIREWTPYAEVQSKLQYLKSEYPDIEDHLLNWQPRVDSSPGLTALACAYRAAALIVLFRLIRNRIKSSSGDQFDLWGGADEAMGDIRDKIQTQLTEVLHYVAEIRVGSAPEGALLFPIFMSGGEAIQDDHIAAIRSRLLLMAEKRQFRNLLQARDVLEDLWALRNTAHGKNADWTQVISATGAGLLLT